MPDHPLRVLIMGACGTAGRSFVKALSSRSVELTLADLDRPLLSRLARTARAAALFCDVTCKSSVESFAARLLNRLPRFDVLINAAGAGYERTLGMHNVSRALMPGLREGSRAKWIINVPPSVSTKSSPIFRYASSEDAFTRLSETIAQEVHGSNITVGIACPAVNKVDYVGSWSAPRCPSCAAGDMNALAETVSDLLFSSRTPG